jgi:hypothetical protein
MAPQLVSFCDAINRRGTELLTFCACVAKVTRLYSGHIVFIPDVLHQKHIPSELRGISPYQER